VRRIGVLAGGDDSATRANLAALREGLAKLGWIEGRNLRTDLRFTGSDPDRMRAYAVELVTLANEVIVTTSFPATRAAQEHTKTVPIVFTAGATSLSYFLLRASQRWGRLASDESALEFGGEDMTEFTKEVALKLKAGGEEGISAFLAVAKIARDEAGVKGLIDWVSVAFKALPKKDRDIAVAMLVDVYFEHDETRLS
jgi:ABC transporter substrate binding protein